MINIYPDVGIELSFILCSNFENHISDYCLLESRRSSDFFCFQFLLLPSEAGTTSGNAPFCRGLLDHVCADLASVNSHIVQLSICVALTKSSHRKKHFKEGRVYSVLKFDHSLSFLGRYGSGSVPGIWSHCVCCQG